MPRIPIHDRHRRLCHLKDALGGHIWMAKCKCGHLAPLPVASLIARYGELYAVEQAMFRVRCTDCGKAGTAEVKLIRLCEPGCGRYRG